MKRPLLIVFLVLLFDQSLKFWVKTNMYLGEEIHVLGNWFILHFTENNGMAFGLELSDGNIGKLFLSIFRIIAVFGIVWYLWHLVKTKAHRGLVFCISLILAGALGNIIDSLFYGILFSESGFNVADFIPAEGGYASFLHGKVVDMLYFPVIKGWFPSWFPFWANEDFVFFRPVFNIADSSITIGVLIILLFQKRFFPTKTAEEMPQVSTGEKSTTAGLSHSESL